MVNITIKIEIALLKLIILPLNDKYFR